MENGEHCQLHYTYDIGSRLIGVADSDPLATDFEFAYDDKGRMQADRQLTGLVDSVYDFHNSYGYDAMSRQTSVVQTRNTAANALSPKSVSLSYDAASQVTDVKRYSSSYLAAGSLETMRPVAHEMPLPVNVRSDLFGLGGCYSGFEPGREHWCYIRAEMISFEVR